MCAAERLSRRSQAHLERIAPKPAPKSLRRAAPPRSPWPRSLALNRATTYDGTSLSASYVRVIEKWRLEAGLKYYGQKDANDLKLTRWTPSANAGYRWADHLTFEGEAGAEYSKLKGPMQTEDTKRHYFNVGFRWDFY